jgi:cytidylate kinase
MNRQGEKSLEELSRRSEEVMRPTFIIPLESWWHRPPIRRFHNRSEDQTILSVGSLEGPSFLYEVFMSRSVEQLVDQQVLRWIAERQIAERAFRRPATTEESAGERQRPVICISRECGSLGGHIGRLVAERLLFSFYAQEIVDEIAKQAHVRRKVVESLDERKRSGVSRWIDELVRLGRFTPTDYMRNLSEVVLTLGRHGRSVIVGRGAFLILDPSVTLRVRCHAPLEKRIAQTAKTHGLTQAEGRAMVFRIDSERLDFYREKFSVDVRDPEHFDLFLNTGTTSETECVDAIVGAFETRFGAPESKVRTKEPLVEGNAAATAGGL